MCEQCVERPREAHLKRLAKPRRKIGGKVRFSLPIRAPLNIIRIPLSTDMADTHPFAGHLVLSRHIGQGDDEHSMAQLALAEGVLLLPTCARLIIHHTKPPPAHRARCPYAQRLCSLALLMCSPAQAVTFAVAVVQRAARPTDIFNLRAAWVQFVGRGGGGNGHLFRGL